MRNLVEPGDAALLAIERAKHDRRKKKILSIIKLPTSVYLSEEISVVSGRR